MNTKNITNSAILNNYNIMHYEQRKRTLTLHCVTATSNNSTITVILKSNFLTQDRRILRETNLRWDQTWRCCSMLSEPQERCKSFENMFYLLLITSITCYLLTSKSSAIPKRNFSMKSTFTSHFLCLTTNRFQEDCYGNGYCGICETCVCYTDREGSQYFDQDNNCAGLCTITNGDYEDCLVNSNGTSGKCYNSHSNLFMQRYNVSLTNERDPQNRKVWVKCNETFDDCGTLEYFAKRDERGDIYVMMVNHCNEIIAEAVVADTKGKTHAINFLQKLLQSVELF